MTTTIFVILFCMTTPIGQQCKPIDQPKFNLFYSLEDCERDMRARGLDKMNPEEWFCAKKEVPVWERAR